MLPKNKLPSSYLKNNNMDNIIHYHDPNEIRYPAQSTECCGDLQSLMVEGNWIINNSRRCKHDDCNFVGPLFCNIFTVSQTNPHWGMIIEI